MNLMNPITNEQMALKYTHICLLKVKITNLKIYKSSSACSKLLHKSGRYPHMNFMQHKRGRHNI